jgi:hypothetical protein
MIIIGKFFIIYNLFIYFIFQYKSFYSTISSISLKDVKNISEKYFEIGIDLRNFVN